MSLLGKMTSLVVAIGVLVGAAVFYHQNRILPRAQTPVLSILSDRDLPETLADVPRLLEQKLLRFPSLPESGYTVVLLQAKWAERFFDIDSVQGAAVHRVYADPESTDLEAAELATSLAHDLVRARAVELMEPGKVDAHGWLIDGVVDWISRFEQFSLDESVAAAGSNLEKLQEQSGYGQLLIEALLQTNGSTVVELLKSPPLREEADQILMRFVESRAKQEASEISYQSRKKGRTSRQSQPTR